ncbi:uncharacterized protein C8A04DRAFT_32334 [Dichotomopilus funicola]|uniref:HTH psq-type domain-containing protein n=1 Tax=Dichotomopilus funicola TaxID=1934379 RepID=A0AAN6UVS8_9PEZI|nr:hypothetical protein C8A04DRAFT_32334 [Dichotomopilus funicola]
MPYSDQDLHDALAKVREKGASVRAAALEFSIPYTTLRSRLHGIQLRREAHKSSQLLLRIQEEALARWVLIQEGLGAAPTHA